MADRADDDELYAGDEAWLAWFDLCAVKRCPADMASALRREVESAMYSRLLRLGFRRDDVEGDDPVSFFDAYFQVKGAKDSPKPLKAYFAYRISAEGMRLRDFVCGTLFGSARGRVKDIVVDWIAANKGWKPRTVTCEDGRRRFTWENAGDEYVAEAEQPDVRDPAAFLDEGPIRAAVEGALEKTSLKTNVEKSKVALLSLATAMDISLTEPAILDGLGVGKSRAYKVKENVMKTLERELRKIEGTDDPLFGRILLEVCESSLDPATRGRLEGAV